MKHTIFIKVSCCLACLFTFTSAPFSQGTQLSTDTLRARRLIDQHAVLVNESNFAGAAQTLEQAQQIYLQHQLWKEAVNTANQLSVLADNFEEAAPKIKYARQALELAFLHLGKGHPVTAVAYRQKAEALMMEEKTDSANYYLALAVPIFQRHKEWTDLAWTKILLGVNFLNQSQLSTSQKHLEAAQALLQENLIPADDAGDVQSTLFYLLGVLYELQGDIDLAIKITQEALSIDLAKADQSAIDASFISGQYNNLGVFYTSKGDYQRAYDHYLLAIHSYEAAAQDPTLLNNIGQLLIWQKKYEEAIEYYRKSLRITQSDQQHLDAKIDALHGLSVAYRELKQYQSAIQYAQAAADLPTAYKKYYTWSILGNAFLQDGAYSKAIQYLEKAELNYQEDKNATVNDPDFEARIYWLQGNVAVAKENYPTALAYYQKALAKCHAIFPDDGNIARNPSLDGVIDPLFFFDALHAKAKALTNWKEESNTKLLAMETYQLCVNWIDTLQIRYTSETTQLDWSSDFKPIYEEAIGLAFELYESDHSSDYLELAFAFSEKSKNAILLENLKAKEAQAQVGIPSRVIEKEKDLRLNIAFYEKTLRTARQQEDNEKAKLYEQYLSAARIELEELKGQIEREYPKYQAWKYGGQTISIAQVQSDLLDRRTTLLEYFLGTQKAYAFLITQEQAMIIPLPATAKINRSVKEFRELLLDLNGFKQNAKQTIVAYQQLAEQVYTNILATPLDILANADDQKNIIIVPDGVLNTIPFAALSKPGSLAASIDFAALPYLLYDYQLSYAYSADLLLKNRDRRRELKDNQRCLAFAPAYQKNVSLAERGSLEQLRGATGQLEGTTQELQLIAKYFDGQFDFGTAATESTFKRLADQFGILHLAMHGTVDFDNPNFSYLAFSNTNEEEKEDNLLYHYEIANLDLFAQLAVLSACETGVGRYETGEGVYSLARSFMYAGVPSIVMSLWKVSDESTSQLIPYFYEALAQNVNKDAALRTAKLRYLKEAALEYRHPYYWSAFVSLGDTQPLQGSGDNRSFLWWILGLTLVIVLIGARRKRNG